MARILIADDDPGMRDIILRALRAAGHEVYAENDTKAALRRVEAVRPDAVIVDWMMPDWPGVAVCQAIRESDPEHNVHVIVTSAMSQPDRVREAFKAGADDFLAKPFSPADLVSRIAAEFPSAGVHHSRTPATEAGDATGTADAGDSAAVVCHETASVRAAIAATLNGCGFTRVDQVEGQGDFSRLDPDLDYRLVVIGNISDAGAHAAIDLLRRYVPVAPLILYATLRERGQMGALPEHTSFVVAGDDLLLEAAVNHTLARRGLVGA